METHRSKTKIRVGTLGPRACEVNLSKILRELDHSRITNKITNLYQEYKDGLKRLLSAFSGDRTFGSRVLALWRKDNFALLDGYAGSLPEDVDSHLRCCMVAEYREALRKLEMEDDAVH